MKPIIFCEASVQAALENRKTMTRRVNTEMPLYGEVFCLDFDRRTYGITEFDPSGNQLCQYERPLKYIPGDILWVRETFFSEPCRPTCPGREDEDECPFNRVGDVCYGYKAQYARGMGDTQIKWRSPIHMPRAAARLFLRVTDVRVERLQEIYVDDAIKEGAWGDGRSMAPFSVLSDRYPDCCIAVASFAYHWDTLNAKRGFPWKANPWVFAYSFEMISREEAEAADAA